MPTMLFDFDQICPLPGAVLSEQTADGVILCAVDQAVAKAQSIAKCYAQLPDASIDAFLARRRQGSGE